MPRKLEFSSYLTGKTAPSIPAEDRDRRGFVLQAQRTLSIKGTLIQQKTRCGSVSVDRGASLQRMAWNADRRLSLTPTLLGTENVHNVTCYSRRSSPFNLGQSIFVGISVTSLGESQLLSMAVALSRLIPNADCRVILVIRHRQVPAARGTKVSLVLSAI